MCIAPCSTHFRWSASEPRLANGILKEKMAQNLFFIFYFDPSVAYTQKGVEKHEVEIYACVSLTDATASKSFFIE